MTMRCNECDDIIVKCDGCGKKWVDDDTVFCADDNQRHLCTECLGYIESEVIEEKQAK